MKTSTKFRIIERTADVGAIGLCCHMRCWWPLVVLFLGITSGMFYLYAKEARQKESECAA